MDINNKKTGLIKIPGALTSTGYEDGVAGIVAYTGDVYDYSLSKNQSDINSEYVETKDRVNGLQNTINSIGLEGGIVQSAQSVAIPVTHGFTSSNIYDALLEVFEKIPDDKKSTVDIRRAHNENSRRLEQKMNSFISCILSLINSVVFHSGVPFDVSQQLTKELELVKVSEYESMPTTSVCGHAFCGYAICANEDESQDDQIQLTNATCGTAILGYAICGEF